MRGLGVGAFGCPCSRCRLRGRRHAVRAAGQRRAGAGRAGVPGQQRARRARARAGEAGRRARRRVAAARRRHGRARVPRPPRARTGAVRRHAARPGRGGGLPRRVAMEVGEVMHYVSRAQSGPSSRPRARRWPSGSSAGRTAGRCSRARPGTSASGWCTARRRKGGDRDRRGHRRRARDDDDALRPGARSPLGSSRRTPRRPRRRRHRRRRAPLRRRPTPRGRRGVRFDRRLPVERAADQAQARGERGAAGAAVRARRPAAARRRCGRAGASSGGCRW